MRLPAATIGDAIRNLLPLQQPAALCLHRDTRSNAIHAPTVMLHRVLHPRSPSLSINHVQKLSFHTTMATGQELKAQLRAKIKGNLAHVSAASIESQSIAAQNVILSMPEYTRAKSVGIYLCMPTSEAQTYALIRDAFKQDKAVFVPYIHAEVKADDMESAGQFERSKPAKKRKVMSMLRLNSLHEYENLKPDSWNIPTLPKSDLETRENANGGKGLQGFTTGEATGGLDLIVMPGVAFDHQMNRMGHGAGYYDKFLASFCKAETRQKPFLVGLCLTEQVLPSEESLVMQDWDWKVDAVAVGDGRLLTAAST